MRIQRIAVSITLLAAGGCTFESPLDPADVSGGITDLMNQVARQVENVVRNPLDQKLYPLLLGGDSTRIYYATNLGDIRITYPGPTNDWVIPGFLGPSNLYVHHDGERRLARPLIPAGALSRMAFDGDAVVFVFSENVGTSAFTERVIASRAAFANQTLLEVSPGDGAFITGLQMSGGRAAVLLASLSDGVPDELRVFDLDAPATPLTFAAGRISDVALRGDRLAYIADGGRIVLYNWIDATTTEIPAGESPWDLTLADNYVVWGQIRPGGERAVYAYSIPTGATTLWADAVEGRIAGATDDHFLTERVETGANNATQRIVITRFEAAGGSKTLADFRADGLAGQAMVIGDRAVFVNADRKIVVVPFEGGERFNFNPY